MELDFLKPYREAAVNNFTRIFVTGLQIAVILIFSQASAQSKIGYVDSEKIRKEYTGMKDAEKEVKDTNQKWDKEMQEMNQRLQKLKDDLNQHSLLLSAAKEKEKQDEIDALITQIQQFQKNKWGDNGEYFRKQEQILKPVYDKIKAAIDKVAEEEKLDIIFDSVQGNILFAKENLDLTEQVMEILKKETPASTQPNRR